MRRPPRVGGVGRRPSPADARRRGRADPGGDGEEAAAAVRRGAWFTSKSAARARASTASRRSAGRSTRMAEAEARRDRDRDFVCAVTRMKSISWRHATSERRFLRRSRWMSRQGFLGRRGARPASWHSARQAPERANATRQEPETHESRARHAGSSARRANTRARTSSGSEGRGNEGGGGGGGRPRATPRATPRAARDATSRKRRAERARVGSDEPAYENVVVARNNIVATTPTW